MEVEDFIEINSGIPDPSIKLSEMPRFFRPGYNWGAPVTQAKKSPAKVRVQASVPAQNRLQVEFQKNSSRLPTLKISDPQGRITRNRFDIESFY